MLSLIYKRPNAKIRTMIAISLFLILTILSPQDPPEAAPKVEGEEGEDPAIFAPAEQQADMKMPGATDLLSTHSAIKASEGAIFDVPPPLHIKFASPSVVQPIKFQSSAVDEFKTEIQRSMGAL